MEEKEAGIRAKYNPKKEELEALKLVYRRLEEMKEGSTTERANWESGRSNTMPIDQVGIRMIGSLIFLSQ